MSEAHVFHVLDLALFTVLDLLTVWCCSYFAQIGDSLSKFDFSRPPTNLKTEKVGLGED